MKIEFIAVGRKLSCCKSVALKNMGTPTDTSVTIAEHRINSGTSSVGNRRFVRKLFSRTNVGDYSNLIQCRPHNGLGFETLLIHAPVLTPNIKGMSNCKVHVN
jgi:hypothetical protein